MKKVLFIRFSSIGDIVLTTPLLRCIKKQHPEVQVHYLTKKSYASILQANPYVDKVVAVEDGLRAVLPELRLADYDHVIDLHKNVRSNIVKMNLRKPHSTFDKLNYEKWLLVRCKVHRLPRIHIVDRYFEAVRSLGVHNDFKGLDYFLPEAEKVPKAQLPATHQNGYIGVVIGGKHKTKVFPEHKLIVVCKQIKHAVMLLGGPEDHDMGERIVSAAGPHVFNACGMFSLHGSASLVQQATRIITNDTGLMHIAAAFRKEILSIWGNTVPDFGMYPYLPKGQEQLSTILQVAHLDCRPCSKLGFETCPKKHFDCMNAIDEQQIIGFANR